MSGNVSLVDGHIDEPISSRKEIYEELVALGYTSAEAWAKITEMEFAEDE